MKLPRFISRLFQRPTPRPIVNRYTVRKVQLEKLKNAKCAELARGLGREWKVQ